MGEPGTGPPGSSQSERSRRGAWALAALLAVLPASVPGFPAAASPAEPAESAEAPTETERQASASLEDLASEDEDTRFGAAMALLGLEGPEVGGLLETARRSPAFAATRRARAGLEFVIAKRAGRAVSSGLPAGGPPGVILISIDTLRADHLGCYGYGRPTSPNIDALASRGILFRQAVAPASWTLPTHMSLLTSLYPSFHKLEKGGKVGNIRLDDAERTLPEVLREAGYSTAGFVANPFLAKEWGFGRGFGLFRRYVTDAGAQSRRAALWIEWHRYHAGRGLAPLPFFLFVHYVDPHEPYRAPAEFRKRFAGGYAGDLGPGDRLVTRFIKDAFGSPEDFRYVVGLYDSEISYVDHSLERIFQALEDTGSARNTLVVLTADHGEEFKDHGAMGHKVTLYDEQILVPLIVSWPARLASGATVSEQVSLLDVAPTIRRAAGAGPVGLEQGIDLLPYLPAAGGAPGRPLPGRRLFADLGPLGVRWERHFYRRAVRTAKYKLIISYTGRGLEGHELYDLEADPGESANIWASMKSEEEIRALEAALVEHIRAGSAYNPGFRERNRLNLDEEMLERLKALGYIDG